MSPIATGVYSLLPIAVPILSKVATVIVRYGPQNHFDSDFTTYTTTKLGYFALTEALPKAINSTSLISSTAPVLLGGTRYTPSRLWRRVRRSRQNERDETVYYYIWIAIDCRAP